MKSKIKAKQQQNPQECCVQFDEYIGLWCPNEIVEVSVTTSYMYNKIVWHM